MDNDIILKLLKSGGDDYRIDYQLLIYKYKEEILKHPYSNPPYSYRLSSEKLEQIFGEGFNWGIVFKKENLEL